MADLSDGVHFRYPHGHREAARRIVACLLAATPAQAAEPEIAGRIVNDLFGEPIGGTWTRTRMNPSLTPTGQQHRIAGIEGEWVSQASATGATLRFPPREANDIWVRYYVDDTSAGAFAWYIDRGTTSEISGSIGTLYPPGYKHYPYSRLLASGLPPGPHQVEIVTILPGPVRIQGITSVGTQ